MNSPTLQDIFRARKRIAALVRRTPLVASPGLEAIVGTEVYLKLETLQQTRSFKARGAVNKLLSLSPEERKRGVVTVSTGNHGRAVAYAAGQVQTTATVCISERVPANKVEALRQAGAELVIDGKGQDDAAERADALRRARGLVMVHPFDDVEIIAGQGTIGLELLEALPALDTVLVPLSGGGLIAGIALALKSASSSIRVVGVSMERSPVMYHSLQAGHPVTIPEEETLADSLLGGIGLENRYTFSIVQRLVDDVVLLTEEEIADGMLFALREHGLVVEGAGAVGLGALLHGRLPTPAGPVAVVVSGGNVALSLLRRLMESEE